VRFLAMSTSAHPFHSANAPTSSQPPVPQRECPDEQPTKRAEPMRQRHRIAQCRCERQAQYQRDADVDRRSQPIVGSIAHRASLHPPQSPCILRQISTRHTALQALISHLTRDPDDQRTNRFSAGVIANAFRAGFVRCVNRCHS
jgi:hypothetical protein